MGISVTRFDRMMAKAEDRGWTKAELARELDVSPQTLTNWQNRDIPHKELPKVAKLFKCSIAELAGEIDSRWPFPNIPVSDITDLDDDEKTDLEELMQDRIARLKTKRLAQNPPRRKISKRS